MLSTLEQRFHSAIPQGIQFCSLRHSSESTHVISVQMGVLQPIYEYIDRGYMVTVHHKGGLGYAATIDDTVSGIRAAIVQAKEWAERSAKNALFSTEDIHLTHPQGKYETPILKNWDTLSLSQKISLLQDVDNRLGIDERIVDHSASLMHVSHESLYLTSGRGRVEQSFSFMAPDINAVANQGSETQVRSFGSRGMSQQGGFEVLDRVRFREAPEQIAREAIALLEAPNCPSGTMSVILMPDQLMLQLHESIGHPLELDRILGDERNYAGTSFVTLDMFGSYQYGSDLLNVTFDPEQEKEFATYAFDDHGTKATKEFLIRDGVLERPLGGSISQKRADIVGVANSRSSSWNRPPIDRMANLNIEPGDETLEELISGVSQGILMRTNKSWSIDDSRNKFQFGCEFGEYIEDGVVKHVVKNPNYKGISASFWRSLTGVGNADTFEVLGTPHCGKGEPNQVIRVGHAAPACRFDNIETFGGAS
jgi:predicted Zn-dependent protease